MLGAGPSLGREGDSRPERPAALPEGLDHRATSVVERVNNKNSVDKQKQADSRAKGPNVPISSVGVYKHGTGLQSPKLSIG